MTEEAARGAPDGDPKSDNGIPEEGGHPRRKWANKMEFLFSVAGQIIGFANIWSFPFLCYVNGGGEGEQCGCMGDPCCNMCTETCFWLWGLNIKIKEMSSVNAC